MINPDIPNNENERLSALYRYEILDTLPEDDLDSITRLASEICQTPISLISLIDKKRQWFKSHHGIENTETPRDVAFCAHAINTPNQAFIVPDSRIDDRFYDNPLVTGAPNVVFYAGIPLLSPDGYALGTLCIVDNKPHELKQFQIDALQLLADQVIRLFELRKANRELEKTKKILEKRNRDLETFASVVSHDLKSPLSNISSFIELFKLNYSNLLDNKGQKLLNYIDDSSMKLRNLVDGILTYYRSDQLLFEKNENVNINQLLNNIINLLSPGDSIKFNLPPNNVINVNKAALMQIFLNLLSNSIRYNNKAQPIIDITCQNNDKYYYFSIKDNGMGIAPDKIDIIFDLFVTGQKKDINGVDSIGIGLPTVKKLIGNLGGDIKVESIPDQFTKFSFSVAKRPTASVSARQ
ncbi:MAG TPA: GAF domain-containing sensor histidine kinase [Prolixibacteraceae bacterium]|nr:GAF domain-containing sensor histidine kinase [Prolixibacteraceae bacterium]HPR60371.1 GAF domain-containing sensor histidine kinase [Prolixibacteraceae bacterium]